MKYKCSGCGEVVCACFSGDNVNDHVHCGKCGGVVTWRDAIPEEFKPWRPWGALVWSCLGAGLFGFMIYALVMNGGETEGGGIIMGACVLTFFGFVATGTFSLLGLCGCFDPNPEYVAEERNRKIVEIEEAAESEAMYRAYVEKMK